MIQQSKKAVYIRRKKLSKHQTKACSTAYNKAHDTYEIGCDFVGLAASCRSQCQQISALCVLFRVKYKQNACIIYHARYRIVLWSVWPYYVSLVLHSCLVRPTEIIIYFHFVIIVSLFRCCANRHFVAACCSFCFRVFAMFWAGRS